MNVFVQTSTATLKRPFSRRFFKLDLDTARYTIAMEMADVRQPEKVLWAAAVAAAAVFEFTVEFYTFVFKSLSPAVSVSISVLHIVRGFSWAGSLRSYIYIYIRLMSNGKLSPKRRAPAKTEIPGG